MFKNNVKVAIRNLVKQKYFTLINIFGLAVGVAASVLIFLWISHEAGFDKYHEKSENIYRVNTNAYINGQNFDVCLVPSAFAERYTKVYPEVEATARITRYFDQVIRYKDMVFKEEKVIRADTGFFQLFSFTFLEGNPEKPFTTRNSAILTKSFANRYFGEESALGKTLILDQNNSVTISAVIEDIPSNSHNQFSMALYFTADDTWNNFNWMTFVRFIDGHSIKNAQTAVKQIVDNDITPTLSGAFGTTVEQFINSGNYINLSLQALESIHLNQDYYGELETSGNKSYITFFSIIAVFILIIASINYMNLSTAYYDSRKMEVGIKKANGAKPFILFRQFISESILVSLVAYLIGILLIELLLPSYQNFLEIEINKSLADNKFFYFLLFIMVLALGFVSGLYPSAYLSRHKITSILQRRIKSGSKRAISLRAALVVTQFTITIMVIVSTLVVKKQVGFLQNKELGFTKDHIVVIEGANGLGDQKEVFKTELQKNAQVSEVCYADTYPGEIYNNINGYGVQAIGAEENVVIKVIGADLDYFNTYQMNIVQGRAFNQEDRNAVVLNESAVKQFGIEENPLKHRLLNNGMALQVVGVVEDFHHDALSISLDPMVIRLNNGQFMNNAIIRLTGTNTYETLRYIEETWAGISNNLPFEYTFLDQKIRSAYSSEMKAGKLFVIFSVLSILIACLGILGIASFIIQHRIKEIGIRKVNGSSTLGVIALLNVDYVRWIAISFLLATPLSYLAMSKWLDNFAFNAGISWWIFIFAGFISMLIATLTVTWQCWKAATRNPVEALRYE